MRHGPYDYPERTMYLDECREQLGAPRAAYRVQLGAHEPGAVTAGKLFGAAIGGAFEGAIIGAVAAGAGRRGRGAGFGALTGAALLVGLTAIGIVTLD